jgi:hypothetical protein
LTARQHPRAAPRKRTKSFISRSVRAGCIQIGGPLKGPRPAHCPWLASVWGAAVGDTSGSGPPALVGRVLLRIPGSSSAGG